MFYGRQRDVDDAGVDRGHEDSQTGRYDEQHRPCPPCTPRSAGGRLEQLDQVARRIEQQDLLSAGPGDHVVAGLDASGPKPGRCTTATTTDAVRHS